MNMSLVPASAVVCHRHSCRSAYAHSCQLVRASSCFSAVPLSYWQVVLSAPATDSSPSSRTLQLQHRPHHAVAEQPHRHSISIISSCSASPHTCTFCVNTAVALAYMWATLKVTLQQTSLQGTNVCKGSTCCTPWAGMHLACQLSSMRYRQGHIQLSRHKKTLIGTCRMDASFILSCRLSAATYSGLQSMNVSHEPSGM